MYIGNRIIQPYSLETYYDSYIENQSLIRSSYYYDSEYSIPLSFNNMGKVIWKGGIKIYSINNKDKVKINNISLHGKNRANDYSTFEWKSSYQHEYNLIHISDDNYYENDDILASI